MPNSEFENSHTPKSRGRNDSPYPDSQRSGSSRSDRSELSEDENPHFLIRGFLKNSLKEQDQKYNVKDKHWMVTPLL